MPDTSQPFAIPCPRCTVPRALAIIVTHTVITLTCLACGHGWSMHTTSLPPDIRQKIAFTP